MAELSTTEIARALAARRKRTQKVCAVCGTAFLGLGRALYCSLACNQAAYRERKGPELRARRMAKYRAQRGRDDDAGMPRLP